MARTKAKVAGTKEDRSLFHAALAAGKAHAAKNVKPFADDGKWWKTYGDDLLESVRIVYREAKLFWETECEAVTGTPWVTLNYASLRKATIAAVKAWDNEFGWDAPRMSEAQEDAFYEWLVGAAMDKEHHG